MTTLIDIIELPYWDFPCTVRVDHEQLGGGTTNCGVVSGFS